MGNLLIVGCGGFLGAVTRYGLSGLVHRYYGGGFPLGTLAVNVLGGLLLGAIMALVQDRQLFAPNMRIFSPSAFWEPLPLSQPLATKPAPCSTTRNSAWPP